MPMNKTLYRYIWNDLGASSFEFLQSILARNPEPYHLQPQHLPTLATNPQELLELLQNHGPALISCCKIEEKFSKSWFHERGPKSPFQNDCTHAMVLVGYRQDANGVKLLLQNWWKDLPYFQV